MQARDVMIPDPVVAHPTTPIREIARLMERESIGIVPIVDDAGQRRLIGVITDRDIAVRCVSREHAGDCTADDHMTRTSLQTVVPTADVDEVVELMERHRVRRIPVVTERGTLVGIISQPDVALVRGAAQPGAIRRLLHGRATRPTPARRREPW